MELQLLLVILPTLLGLISSTKTLLRLLNWAWDAFFRPPKDLKRCYGSWALVTGAADGIGRAMSIELANRGLNLILLDRDVPKLETTAKEILQERDDVEVRTLVSDLAKDSGIEIVRKVREVIEGVDVGVVINNAGTTHWDLLFFDEVESGVVESMVRVNVEGATWVTKAVVPLMMERRRGAIVNIGSASASLMPSFPLFTVYAATKQYIQLFSTSISREYKHHGIDVQCQSGKIVLPAESLALSNLDSALGMLQTASSLVSDLRVDREDELVRKLREVIEWLDVRVVINNAGTAHRDPLFFDEVDDRAVESIVRVNAEVNSRKAASTPILHHPVPLPRHPVPSSPPSSPLVAAPSSSLSPLLCRLPLCSAINHHSAIVALVHSAIIASTRHRRLCSAIIVSAPIGSSLAFALALSPLLCNAPPLTMPLHWREFHREWNVPKAHKMVQCYFFSSSKELGRDCMSLELYLHVHTKKHDGHTFIDARSERVNRMREEMSQLEEEAGDDPLVDEIDLYYKVVGVDHKGRVYGLRSTGRRYNDPGASSSQGPSRQDFATLQSNVSRLTSIVEDQQNQIQTQHDQIALLQSMLMQSMRGGHPGASSSHPPPPPPPPPPRPSHQETLTPPMAVPTPGLDANDVYHPRMYEPEDEEQTNLPLQQKWIDAFSDIHPLS
ncbi:hypothetical protein Sjap_023409 [Stephania japonica]|uniref:Uncharacterized protein n=1 Tax=Stephania japonica TaxID=461633 RepID=A0AAP0EEM5_9MAGN